MKTLTFSLALCLVALSCGSPKASSTTVTPSIPLSPKAAVLAFQQEMNTRFKDPKESPLSPKDLKQFESLDFFPFNPDFRVIAKFIRTPDEQPFEMPTTTSRKPAYSKFGEVHFTLNQKSLKLNVYRNEKLAKKEGYENYLFLPYTDASNGTETYGGGRYIDLSIPRSSQMVIDFNKSYNPYCAYRDNYSCPIPPAENDLNLAILAGEKVYEKH